MAKADDEDGPPTSKKRTFDAQAVDPLSIAELENYILDLKGEILRVEKTIAAKRSVRAGADSLFGKKPS